MPDPSPARTVIWATEAELAAAFLEWDRRGNPEPGARDPEREARRESEGAARAAYLIALLNELRPPGAGDTA